jgi:hypothetical protein
MLAPTRLPGGPQIGLCLYTCHVRRAFRAVEPNYFELMTKRHTDQGVLVRAARASSIPRPDPFPPTSAARLSASCSRGRSATSAWSE